jgi:hypothetical protein
MLRGGLNGVVVGAGSSAQREYERVRDVRRSVERRVLPKMLVGMAVLAVVGYVVLDRILPGAGLVAPLLVVTAALPMLGPSSRERAWRRGAEGERLVGAALDRLEPHGWRVLHDRRMPRSRANIDHLVVGPGVVFTVDAKRYTGRLVARRGALIIKGRDRSKLLDQARRQRDAVRAALDAAGYPDVTTVPVLCFSGVEWPLLFRPHRIGDVLLCSPRRLRRTLTTGRSDTASMAPLVAALEAAFPPVIGDASSVAVATATRPATSGHVQPRGDEGGSSTAPCVCGAPMVVRARRRDGARFLGCSTFPSCRRTQPL